MRSMATVATLAALCAAGATSVLAQNPAVTINVDVNANRRPINPDIYGVAHATTVQLNDLNSPLNRNGGNNTTRYNWQANADNRGNDWYFREHRRQQCHRRRARRYVLQRNAGGQRPADADHSDDRMGRQSGRRQKQARELFDCEVRAADRQRLAVVSRRGQRRQNQRSVRDRQRSERRERAVRRRLPARLGAAPGQSLGNRRERRAAALHPRQRAQHLAHDASRRPPDWRDDGRGAGQDRRVRRDDQRHRSVGDRRGARGVGLERLFRTAATISSTARTYGCEPAPRSQEPRQRRLSCRGCSINSVNSNRPPGAASWTSSPSTTTRRAASSATMSRARCRSGATARRDRCGIRTTSTKPGSTIGCVSSLG